MLARLTIRENGPPLEATSVAELDQMIASAAEEARRLETPNIIFIKASSGNEISMVVGSPETVLAFTYGHLDPPYYASKGKSREEAPVFTAFVSMNHHTEYPRKWVIPLSDGMRAVREFVNSGDLPTSIEWETL